MRTARNHELRHPGDPRPGLIRPLRTSRGELTAPYPRRVKMHDDELDIGDDTVGRLIATQFPEWSAEPISRLPGSGTVNAIFRIGDRFAARFPLRGSDAAVTAQLRAEAPRWTSSRGQPLPGATSRRDRASRRRVPSALVGADLARRRHRHSRRTRRIRAVRADLAELIGTLRAVDTKGRRFSGSGRGGNLRAHDDWVEECIRESARDFDAPTLTSLWATCASCREPNPTGWSTAT